MPLANAPEVSVVADVEVYGAERLTDVINHLTGTSPIEPAKNDMQFFMEDRMLTPLDFADVRIAATNAERINPDTIVRIVMVMIISIKVIPLLFSFLF